MTHVKSLLLSAGLLICGVACSETSPPIDETREGAAKSAIVDRAITLTLLAIPNAPEGSISQRGVITVPVNRTKPDGQTIEIEFFRFQRLAEANPETPPIVLLRGGPGYPGLGDAIENEAFYNGSIARYTRL